MYVICGQQLDAELVGHVYRLLYDMTYLAFNVPVI